MLFAFSVGFSKQNPKITQQQNKFHPRPCSGILHTAYIYSLALLPPSLIIMANGRIRFLGGSYVECDDLDSKCKHWDLKQLFVHKT